MKDERIYLRLNNIEFQISLLSEKMYNPELSISEIKRINKKKSKLDKDAEKLRKKLNEHQA